MIFSASSKSRLPTPDDALPGRDTAMAVARDHFVSGRPLAGPHPDGARILDVGMGCFWGAERAFWQTPGVWVTAVGYQGGSTPHPTYQEVCSGRTGHAEVVRVVYQPELISLDAVLKVFWEGHDPTQGMRQGNDVGSQYRSTLYAHNAADLAVCQASARAYQDALSAAGAAAGVASEITTEITLAGPFYFAEDAHQQYLAKNPGGYCGMGGTGVACPIGTGVKASPGDAGASGASGGAA